jgi:uncharacterized lipoprotein
MKKLVIELCCVIVLAACGNGKEQNTVEEDSTAKALLQGVWIDDETELPLMRIEGDTIYYADPQYHLRLYEIRYMCTAAIP